MNILASLIINWGQSLQKTISGNSLGLAITLPHAYSSNYVAVGTTLRDQDDQFASFYSLSILRTSLSTIGTRQYGLNNTQYIDGVMYYTVGS